MQVYTTQSYHNLLISHVLHLNNGNIYCVSVYEKKTSFNLFMYFDKT